MYIFYGLKRTDLCVYSGPSKVGKGDVDTTLRTRQGGPGTSKFYTAYFDPVIFCNPATCDQKEYQFDGLMQEKHNSVTNALELRLFGIDSSICQSFAEVQICKHSHYTICKTQESIPLIS